jgi:hypothetical protein
LPVAIVAFWPSEKGIGKSKVLAKIMSGKNKFSILNCL